MKDYIGEKGIELIIDPEIEELEICCDPKEIERCIVNLIGNAVKFTDENGEIHLSYLRPGVYCLYESEPLTGYIKNEEVWEFQIREDGTVEGEQEKILEIENHHTRITDTHAVWKESKAKENQLRK